MPEPQSRLDEEPAESSLPLRIIKVYIPESRPDAPWIEDEDRYTVALQLSRDVNEYELGTLGEFVVGMLRVYGSTLEVSNTTLEEIEANKVELAQIVSRMEEHGRLDQEAAEAQRAQDEADRASEAERLQKQADRITFDDIR